jgi:hypothetical protein
MASAPHDPGSLPHGNRVPLLAQDLMSTSLALMALEVHRRPNWPQGPGALGGGPGAYPGGRGGDGGVSRCGVSLLLGPQRVLFCWGMC